MAEFIVSEKYGHKCLSISGRIDGIASPEIEKRIKEITVSGERTLILDLKEVSFLSSVGIKVFTSSYKMIKEAGGEIIFINTNSNIYEIFKISGLSRLFKFLSTEDELTNMLTSNENKDTTHSISSEKANYKYKVFSSSLGKMFTIGNLDKLAPSEYTEHDVQDIVPAQIKFGTGLSALGDSFSDYKDYFGESIIINNNMYFYPSVKKPAADFNIYIKEDNITKYKFLNGYGFDGFFNKIISFETKDELIRLNTIINEISEIASSNVFGMVIIFESKGLWGMHLKQVPILENKPSNDKEIFDNDNFSNWMNFPVEPTDINNIIVATGLVVKDKARLNTEYTNLFPKEGNYHLHCAVFDKGLVNLNIDNFSNELTKIINDMNLIKVQHILGQTQFKNGIVGLIELEG